MVTRARTNGEQFSTELATDGYSQRMRAAAARALGDLANIERTAKRIGAGIDEATPAHGVPLKELPDDDSMVIATQVAMGGKAG